MIGNQHISVALIAQTIQADASSFFASPTNAVELASRVGEIALQAILVVIVTFYFLVDGASLRDRTIRVLPLEHRTRTIAVLGRIHAVLGKWLRGQLAADGPASRWSCTSSSARSCTCPMPWRLPP